jgi:Flp pilus assembly pilin Flp
MKSNLVALFKNERGQVTIEYLVTAAAVGLIVYLSCSNFGQATIAGLKVAARDLLGR